MKKFKPIWLLALLLMALLVNGGCGGSDAPKNAEQAKFENFVNRAFLANLTQNTIDTHSMLKNPEAYGIDTSTVKLWDTSPESMAALVDKDRELSEELLTVRREMLTPAQQKEYDIYSSYIDADIDAEFLLYANPLSPGSAIAQLPVILMEYRFYTRRDIDDYLLLLKDLPRLFGDAALLLRAQSRAGLFMPDYAADDAAESMESYLTGAGQDFFTVAFDQRVDEFEGLTDAERIRYKEENLNAVKNYVRPAYEELAGVVTSLKGTGKNEGGVAGLKNGTRYYEQLIRQMTGLSESVEDIMRQVEAAAYDIDDEILTMLEDNPDLLDKFIKFFSGEFEYGETDPRTILENLENRIRQDFPEVSGVSRTVKYVPEALEEIILNPAFYMIPPLDSAEENVIYINRAQSYAADLYYLLTHEGYPGHLYQINYSYRSVPMQRLVLSFPGFNEGWATYAEQFSYGWAEYGRRDPELANVLRLDNRLGLLLSAWADMGVNYEGWTLEQTVEKFGDFPAYLDAVPWLYEYVAQAPGDYVVYAATNLKIEELKSKAQSALGSGFSLMEFHRAVLDAGPCYFDAVERAVDSYIVSKGGSPNAAARPARVRSIKVHDPRTLEIQRKMTASRMRDMAEKGIPTRRTPRPALRYGNPSVK